MPMTAPTAIAGTMSALKVRVAALMFSQKNIWRGAYFSRLMMRKNQAAVPMNEFLGRRIDSR